MLKLRCNSNTLILNLDLNIFECTNYQSFPACHFEVNIKAF